MVKNAKALFNSATTPETRPVGMQGVRRCSSSASHLLRLRPLAAATRASTATVYVQGFLTPGATATDFERWRAAHASLERSELQWSADAWGFPWATGSAGDRLGKWPLPTSSAAAMAWWIARRARVTPTSIAAAVLGDAIANAARMYQHYRAAESRLDEEAARLASTLSGFTHPYRVRASAFAPLPRLPGMVDVGQAITTPPGEALAPLPPTA